jgi:hypothetical protein
VSNDNPMSIFPQMRIKPYDGMPVTADIWDKAHAYHRQAAASHNLFFHGAGILTGLEVAASDPADHIVFVLPGVAVDPSGQVIVLPEPVAYDLGAEIDGPLYLLLSHRESTVGDEKTKKENALQYTRDEFLLTARAEIPQGAWLELARFTRADRSAAIHDAADPAHPKVNELDLRYRPVIIRKTEKLVTAALVTLGSEKADAWAGGLLRLGEEVCAPKNIRLVVDQYPQLTPDVLGYDLLILAGSGKFTLSAAQTGGLKSFVEGGGVIYMDAGDAAAAEVFGKVITQTGVKLKEVAQGHALLGQPCLFAQPPAGFTAEGELKAGQGLIFSTYNYGRLWNGETAGHTPTREEIRSALEFGLNIIFSV